jgi:hypothetical protein
VPLELGDSTPTVIPAGEIKNGRTTFTDSTVLTAPDPDSVTPTEAGCQNDNWNVSFLSLVVTSVTVEVSQGGDTIVTCTRTNQNGLPNQFTFTRQQYTFA